MECSQCQAPYDQGQHTPKILIKCGHTLCSFCITEQVEKLRGTQENGECPDCHTRFPLALVEEFPVNIALLSFAQGAGIYLATMQSSKPRKESLDLPLQISSEKKQQLSGVKKHPRRSRHIDPIDSLDGLS